MQHYIRSERATPMPDARELPPRAGPRPHTTPVNPHMQPAHGAAAGGRARSDRQRLGRAARMARPGYIPETVVMVYGPRDAGELDVVLELLRASHRAAAPRPAGDTNDDEKRRP